MISVYAGVGQRYEERGLLVGTANTMAELLKIINGTDGWVGYRFMDSLITSVEDLVEILREPGDDREQKQLVIEFNLG